MCLKDEEEPAR
jgi:hypothetical protein